MSDKRKPVFTFLLKNTGKKSNKIEVFEAIDFFKVGYIPLKENGKTVENSYRIRVNGSWYPKGERMFYWRSEIRDLIFKSIRF